MILPISGTGTGGVSVYSRIGNAGSGTAARYLGFDINLPNAAVRFYWTNTYSGPTTVSSGTLALGTNSLYGADPTGYGVARINSYSLVVKQGGIFDVTGIPQGYVVPEGFTHGTSEQRVRWFLYGLKTETPEQVVERMNEAFERDTP